jgi:hypothetical protein
VPYPICNDMRDTQSVQIHVVVSYILPPRGHRGETHSGHLISEKSIPGILQERAPVV